MSHASERKRMVEAVAGYALMSVPDFAGVLGCSPEVAHKMLDDGVVPSVQVGKRQKVDPVDAGVYVLAQREGVSPAEYWERFGEGQTVENVRKFYTHAARVKNIQGAA